MKTLEGYTICIVEGNDFTLVLPLKSRTYEACRPIDEDIIIRDLQDVVVKIGADVYQSTLEDDGVHVRVEGTISRGNYSVQLTAKYHGIDIHAAYMNALSIVAWNNYSNAQQYLTGSPVVMPAAYVLGVMTDEETEALKAELRLKIAAAEQAKEDADAAKADWEQKAAGLEGVAQQGTNPDATNTAILEAVQSGGGDDVAKESTSQSILSDLQSIIDAHIITGVSSDGYVFTDGTVVYGIGAVLAYPSRLVSVTDSHITDLALSVFQANANLQSVSLPNLTSIKVNFSSCSSLQYVNLPSATSCSTGNLFSQCTSIEEIDLSSVTGNMVIANCCWRCINLKKFNALNVHNMYGVDFFASDEKLIDIITGRNFDASTNSSALQTWNPTEALRTDVGTLVEPSETFANNREKLLYNIREHIAANLPDRTGQTPLTITFHANVKAAIQADPETAAAFTNKYWNIA